MSVLRKLLLAAVVYAIGCSSPQDSTGVGNPGLTTQEQELYDDGDESRKAGDIAGALAFVPHGLITKPDDVASSDGAAALGSLGTVAFGPASCRTATRAANVVTFSFNNCDFSAGYTGVTGQLRATYTSSGGVLGIRVETVAPFTLGTFNKRLEPITITLRLTSEVTVFFVSGGKRYDWTTDYEATAGGATLTHKTTTPYSSTRTTSDDGQCVTLAGDSTTTFPGGRGVAASVVGYRRCGNQRACPDAGGKVTFTSTADSMKFITIEFLGGRNVRVTVPNRPAFETDKLLQCTG